MAHKELVKISLASSTEMLKLPDSPTFVPFMITRRLLSLLLTLFLFGTAVPAQQLSGIWKGYFVTKEQNQYKIEVQIKEKGGQLTGVTYSYLDVRFYGKATMTGNADKKLGKVLMQEIKTVEVRSSDSSETCIMNYQLSYSRSGNEEYLEGTYTSKYEKNGNENRKGADCGGGIVFLRRVYSSDFDNKTASSSKPLTKKVYYNEAPPAKKQNTASAPVVANKVGSTKVPAASRPATGKPAPSAALPGAAARKPTAGPSHRATPETAANASHATEETEGKEKADESVKTQAVVKKYEPEPVTNSRQNELIKEVLVSTREINISVYDNGEIDGDTVSVYLNGQVVLSKKRLSSSPLQLRISLGEEQDVQELTFVADNLGRIPPNTALMIVDTGIQQYRLQVLSTEKKNAVFRFRYQPSR